MNKNIHFVYGLRDSSFSIVDHLAIKSARVLNPDFTIYYWHSVLPDESNPWWVKTKPFINHLCNVGDASEWCGKKINHVAHQADLIRLPVLYSLGGVYLDMDTLCVTPFADWLFKHDLVIGMEHDGNGCLAGFPNAVMIGKARSNFLFQWLKHYDSFDQSKWGYHSVQLPKTLRNNGITGCCPVDKQLLGPMWWETDKIWNQINNLDDHFCFHLWASHARSKMDLVTEESIRMKANTYSVYASRFL